MSLSGLCSHCICAWFWTGLHAPVLTRPFLKGNDGRGFTLGRGLFSSGGWFSSPHFFGLSLSWRMYLETALFKTKSQSTFLDNAHLHSCYIVLRAPHDSRRSVESGSLLEGHRDVVRLRDVLDGRRARVRIHLNHYRQFKHQHQGKQLLKQS